MTITETLEPHSPPIRLDEDGILRVGLSRIPVEHVLWRHQKGDSVQEILDAFPSLDEADIYAVISYHLRNRAIVEEYLRRARDDEERVALLVDQNAYSQELKLRIRSRRDAR